MGVTELSSSRASVTHDILWGPHQFHIPVMGTGFTIDTPLRVGRYGISSVISLVDDQLIEQIRQRYCETEGEPYHPIKDTDDDPRAHRITAYLDLVHGLLNRQVKALQSTPFKAGSEITRYFELLPDCPLRTAYQNMLAETDSSRRATMENALRARAVPGRIDVNIMTKLDSPTYQGRNRRPPLYNDAMAALRGFARSKLSTGVVFSAGMNPALYTYTSEFPDFHPDQQGHIHKQIILKVSDYRSAFVQGKFLARRGLWVSEFRIESGLNCGGHAFPTQGLLVGPVLDEFRVRRDELRTAIYKTLCDSCNTRSTPPPVPPPPIRVTYQGGIGTAEEHGQLIRYYELDGTGWGTPFLLCPEVTNVDENLLDRLSKARGNDVFLSDASPLNIPFWNLRNSDSEQARELRIQQNRPGSACPKNHALTNTEFTEEPICIASRAYQARKLEQLEKQSLPPEIKEFERQKILSKSCICHDLGGSVLRRNAIDATTTPAICPGPNLAGFSRIFQLEELIGHIYGRLSVLADTHRSHVLIQELRLYLQYLRRQIELASHNLIDTAPRYFEEFRDNLYQGIEYYRNVARDLIGDSCDRFLEELKTAAGELESLVIRHTTPAMAGTQPRL